MALFFLLDGYKPTAQRGRGEFISFHNMYSALQSFQGLVEPFGFVLFCKGFITLGSFLLEKYELMWDVLLWFCLLCVLPSLQMLKEMIETKAAYDEKVFCRTCFVGGFFVVTCLMLPWLNLHVFSTENNLHWQIKARNLTFASSHQFEAFQWVIWPIKASCLS